MCFDLYNNPRLLKCGHQFCEICLKQIADHTPQRHIPCPVCREVTKPQHGDVTTLPRSTLHQYMQELIFRQPTQEAMGQKCTKCKVNKPTRHCPECTADLAYLCDKCFEVHEKIKRFEKHNAIQFDPMLICPSHPNKLVENFCYKCNVVACTDCMFDKHADHETENLDAAAEKARKLLNDFMIKLDGNILDMSIVQQINNAELRLQEVFKQFKTNLEKIKLAWNKLKGKLDHHVNKMYITIDRELQLNSVNQTKIAKVCAAQELMLKLAISLQEDISDPQVIMGSRNLPEPDIDLDTTEIEVYTPVVGKQFDKIVAQIESMLSAVDISYSKEIYKIQRRKKYAEWNLKHDRDINIETGILGLSFVGNTNKELLVRVQDLVLSIIVYNTDGKLIKQMGEDIEGLTGFYKQVAIDTRRNLYLISDNTGCLVRMESDGTFHDLTFLDCELWGVAYLTKEDLYVLSGILPGKRGSKMFLVFPETLTVVKSLVDKGTFCSPYNVCVGDINGSTTIVVSDCDKDTLYLYSVSGELLKSYGPDIHPLGKLTGPWDLSVDWIGRIVVCDRGNYRVLRVWSDKDGDHWECLLDKEQLGGYPRCVDIDNDNRLMAVSVEQTVKLYTF